MRPVPHWLSRRGRGALGAEAAETVDRGGRIGARRLARPVVGDAVTAFLGGMSVSFGVVAMAWAAASFTGPLARPSVAHLVGALAFPVGFLHQHPDEAASES